MKPITLSGAQAVLTLLRDHKRQVLIRWLEAEQAIEVGPEVGKGVACVLMDASTFAQEAVDRAKEAAFHGLPLVCGNALVTIASEWVSRAKGFGFRQISATWTAEPEKIDDVQ